MNAPRALPIVRGPVGLADTNSTFTRRGRIGCTRPQSPGAARTPAIVCSRARSVTRRLTKPGGAASAAAIGLSPAPTSASRPISSASTWAISSGARRYGRASRIARFEAKSPCSGFAGRSMSTAGRSSGGSGGSVPAAIARSHARSTAALARVRIGGGWVSAGAFVTGAHGSRWRARDGSPPSDGRSEQQKYQYLGAGAHRKPRIIVVSIGGHW